MSSELITWLFTIAKCTVFPRPTTFYRLLYIIFRGRLLFHDPSCAVPLLPDGGLQFSPDRPTIMIPIYLDKKQNQRPFLRKLSLAEMKKLASLADVVLKLKVKLFTWHAAEAISLERNTSSPMHHLKRCILHSSVSCIGIFESVCIVPFPTHIEKLSFSPAACFSAAARQPQRRFAPQYDGRRSDQEETHERQEPFYLQRATST